MNHLVHARVSRAALRHNVRLLRQLSRPAKLCAMVKANAYGHDATLVTRALAGLADAWGVATLPEAVALRAGGLREPILVFCPLDDYYGDSRACREALDAVIDHQLQPVITAAAGLELLARHARRRRQPVGLHIKVDTGMGRSGCPPAELLPLLQQAARAPFLQVAGLCSHFAGADAADLQGAREQARIFARLAQAAAAAGRRPPLLHLANSAAIFNLPAARWDMVRPGIAMYGYGGNHLRGSRRLRPALAVDAPVVMTKRLPKGHACGYGATFITRRPTRIGLVYAGYADGYNRRLSNAGVVDFDGRRAPVLGRVSMDAIIVDITNIPAAGVGSRARLISPRRADPHSVESLARALDTIPHEITCALGPRVSRCLVA